MNKNPGSSNFWSEQYFWYLVILRQNKHDPDLSNIFGDDRKLAKNRGSTLQDFSV